MTIADIVYILAGSALLGVLTGAVAERILYGKRSRSPRNTRLAIATVVKPGPLVRPAANPTPLGIDPMSRDRLLRSDVISALKTAGYKHLASVAAADACALSERATLESWTRAALKHALGEGRYSS